MPEPLEPFIQWILQNHPDTAETFFLWFEQYPIYALEIARYIEAQTHEEVWAIIQLCMIIVPP